MCLCVWFSPLQTTIDFFAWNYFSHKTDSILNLKEMLPFSKTEKDRDFLGKITTRGKLSNREGTFYLLVLNLKPSVKGRSKNWTLFEF
jgi:hypothetical protein